MEPSVFFKDKPYLLVIEDDPGHAAHIASAALERDLKVVVGYIPYAQIDSSWPYKKHLNNIFVVKRDSEDQNLGPLYEYLSGKPRSTLFN